MPETRSVARLAFHGADRVGISVPVSGGYFIKNSIAAIIASGSLYYRGVQGEVLLFLRANLRLPWPVFGGRSAEIAFPPLVQVEAKESIHQVHLGPDFVPNQAMRRVAAVTSPRDHCDHHHLAQCSPHCSMVAADIGARARQ